jgi:nicotinamide phosphoribosyltransferase
LRSLAARFGTRTNAKGYRVLADCVRVIQGDGMDLEGIERVGEAVLAAGFSAENVAYGMGAGLLQKVDRDTMRFAMKTSAIEIDGAWHDVYKAPRTDPSKRSKAGRLALVRTAAGWSDRGARSDATFETIRREALGERENLLVPIYRNGELSIDRSLREIRERARATR